VSDDQLSFANPQIQRLRRLLGRRSARSEDGAFVIEGPGLIAEAVSAGWEFEAQFVAPNGSPIDGAGAVRLLADGVLERVATTENPQPILAVVRIAEQLVPRAVPGEFVVVADRLADPGNLGTILRSAEAAGGAGVVLTPGSVDPFNPKVIRASAGALFHVPFAVASLDEVRQAGWWLLGTSSHQGTPYTEADVTRSLAIVVGNEANGLSDDAPVDEWITIPHHGRTESLNVAMAATVVCFDLARRGMKSVRSSGGR
jgi:RNA methyltransferase, TrmH family